MEFATLSKCLSMFSRKYSSTRYRSPNVLLIYIVSTDLDKDPSQVVNDVVSEIQSVSDMDWIDRTGDDYLQENTGKNIIINCKLKMENDYKFSFMESRHRLMRRSFMEQKTILIASGPKYYCLPSFMIHNADIFIIGSGDKDDLYEIERDLIGVS